MSGFRSGVSLGVDRKTFIRRKLILFHEKQPKPLPETAFSEEY